MTNRFARKLGAVAALGMAAVGVVSACSAPAAVTTDTINTTLWYAPSTFDPAMASSSPDKTVARLGFDTLLRKAQDGQYIGGLASEWEATSTSDYVFTLREDLTCSDGTAITPKVVTDSLKYLAASDNSGAKAWAQLAFGAGQPTFTEIGTNQVGITLSQPYSQLIPGMALEGTGIICPAGLADPEGLAAGTVPGAFSGPYAVSATTPGVSVTYDLRDDYDAWPQWKDVSGKPAKTFNITVERDSNTSANLLASGGLDLARFYDANAKRFLDDDAYSEVTDDGTGNFLLFNEAPTSVFAGARDLRKAAAQAVSAQAFNDAAQDGLGQLMTSVTSDTFPCVIDDPKLLVEPNTEEARKQLTGKTIRLLAMTNWDNAIDYVSEALRTAGANVDVTKLDAADWNKALRSNPESWDMTVRADANTSALVYQTLSRLIGPSYAQGGINLTSSDNKAGEQAIATALNSPDPAVQCAQFKQAQVSLLDRVDVAPLATSTHYIFGRPGVELHTFSGYWDITSTRLRS